MNLIIQYHEYYYIPIIVSASQGHPCMWEGVLSIQVVELTLRHNDVGRCPFCTGGLTYIEV